jgi:hypothetical protein
VPDDNFSERDVANPPDIMASFDFGEFDDDSDLEESDENADKLAR